MTGDAKKATDIRNATLDRFTLDRLFGIFNCLGSNVEVKLKVRPAARIAYPAADRTKQVVHVCGQTIQACPGGYS